MRFKGVCSIFHTTLGNLFSNRNFRSTEPALQTLRTRCDFEKEMKTIFFCRDCFRIVTRPAAICNISRATCARANF